MKSAKNKRKTAQDVQDEIFRKMTIEEKLKLSDSFFNFAKELQKSGKKYHGTKQSTAKSRLGS